MRKCIGGQQQKLLSASQPGKCRAEVLEHMVDRAARLDGQINAIIRDLDRARATGHG